MLVLGTSASQNTKSFLGGDFESIATTTVGAGGAATVTFSSIPSTYTHLQIRGIARNTRAVAFDNIYIYFNSDTAANYSSHFLYGDGSTTGAGASTNATDGGLALSVGASSTASCFGVGIIDILDYANTNKYKTYRSLTGGDANGSGQVLLRSGNWRSNSAITSMTLFPTVGNFTQYSSFALYGIKG
jgi:hypothetical protein